MSYRKGLPHRPRRIRSLPLDARGYPTPWFVAERNGVRDFRMADGEKRARAVREHLCWICGQKLGRYFSFAIGPMCAVNRNTSEPPNHLECADYAARACPFMTLPAAQYRSANMPAEARNLPHSIGGNPGVVCLWITDTFRCYEVSGSWLIRIGTPVEVHWYAHGRSATRAEVVASLDERLPALLEIAQGEGEGAIAELKRMIWIADALLPAGSVHPALISS